MENKNSAFSVCISFKVNLRVVKLAINFTSPDLS